MLDDDTDTMVALVGRRVVPIPVKDDGQAMLESMDMVRYIDGLGASVLTGIERPEISRWEAEIAPKATRLTQPRYLLLGLPEFATAAALDHYQLRKRRTLGSSSPVIVGDLNSVTRENRRTAVADVSIVLKKSVRGRGGRKWQFEPAASQAARAAN